MSQFKKGIEDVEEVLCPTLWSRILTKLLIVIVLFILLAVGVKLSYGTFIDRPDEIDRTWFVGTQQEIQGLDLEISAAEAALQRHQKEVKSRSGLFSVSRKEDRAEERRLNNSILGLQQRRIELIKKYNLQAVLVKDPKILQGLPISLGAENEPRRPRTPGVH